MLRKKPDGCNVRRYRDIEGDEVIVQYGGLETGQAPRHLERDGRPERQHRVGGQRIRRRPCEFVFQNEPVFPERSGSAIEAGAMNTTRLRLTDLALMPSVIPSKALTQRSGPV